LLREARLGTNCEEHARHSLPSCPINRHGAAERKRSFAFPDRTIAFGFLEIIANGRIAIAHRGPRGVAAWSIVGRFGGWSSWHRSTAPDASQRGAAGSSPEGVPRRRASALARCRARSPASAACPGYSIDAGRRHAGRSQMANGELADLDEGQAQSPLRRCPRPHRRWATAADQR
jgi:hypothetical protein